MDALDSIDMPIRIFISCRPEQHLEAAFAKPREALSSHLDLNKVFCNDDIFLFLQDKFAEIRDTHPIRSTLPSNWPGPAVLSDLVSKASGQFIYASTVVKYVGSTRRPPPMSRLQTILGMRESSKQSDPPFSTIDALYSTILSAAGDDTDIMLDILCLAFTHPDMDARFPDQFLSLEKGESQLVIGQLASVLTIQEIWRRPWIVATHASFGEFLRDPSRSKEFYLDTPQRHARIATRCFGIMKESDQGKLFVNFK